MAGLACAVALLAGACASEPPSPATLPADQLRDCSVTLYHDGPGRRVSVVGDFNGWTPGVDVMPDPDRDGHRALRLSLPPGEHRYRIDVDGVTSLDRFNPATRFDELDREHSLLSVPDCASPAWRDLEVRALPDQPWTASARMLRAADGAPMASVNALLDPGQHKLAVIFEAESGRVEVQGPALPTGRYRLTLTGQDDQGREVEPLSSPFWVEAVAFDWRDAVVYQVVVDRFRNEDGHMDNSQPISFYHGGDLWGVLAALEEGYFERLGANVLWLSPLYDNPEGRFIGRDGHEAEAYHGYWPMDPRAVEGRFGGEAALDALVQAAHARGVRVLMDVVMNHVHEQHPYVREHGGAWLNHPDGGCICGFTCDWGSRMETCWFDPFLPDLRLTRPEVSARIVEDTAWWAERFELDGFRVDAVPMMPRAAIRELRRAVGERQQRAGVHHYMLGETYTSRGQQGVVRYYLGEHSLSGQFDFPVMWALRSALAGREGFEAVDTEVLISEAAWEGSGAVMAPILGNHDVPRFISDVNGDDVYRPRELQPGAPDPEAYEAILMGWAFVLTQPGAPVIYYGDEVAMPGANDPDNRRDMPSPEALDDDQRRVLARVEALGRARRCSEALRRGRRETLFVHRDVYVYGRDAGDGDPVVVLLNRGDEPERFDLALPEGWALRDGARFEDLFGQPVGGAGRRIEVEAPARGAVVLMTECVEESGR